MIKVKLMMIALMMCLVGLSYGQNDSLINESNTNKVLMMGNVMNSTYTFKIYNDSLVRTVTGGSMLKSAIRNKIPTSDVIILKLQILSIGNIKNYKYEDETKSIQISVKPNGDAIIIFRIKDSFSGKITELMYY
jgi:hypothetical protein